MIDLKEVLKLEIVETFFMCGFALAFFFLAYHGILSTLLITTEHDDGLIVHFTFE